MPDIRWPQIQRMLPELYERGIRILILEGGEPLLWKDGTRGINDVIVKAKKYFFCIGVTTNGTLPLDIESDIIWVSIDGLQEMHDRLRGKSFERIISNIEGSKHPKIFANITINRLNYNEIGDLVKHLEPLVKGITIQFFYPYSESDELLLSWKDRAAVLEKLKGLKKEGYPVSDSILVLDALKSNNWSCEPWLIANIEPDGTYNHGCYLKNRASDNSSCKLCGFAAHAEISLAYQLRWGAIAAGREILGIF